LAAEFVSGWVKGQEAPAKGCCQVRVTRSFEQRLAWLMDHIGTDNREAAESELRRSDTAHAARMNAQFGVTWGDPLLYDLVLILTSEFRDDEGKRVLLGDG